MGFLSSGLFWGAVLVIFGISILLKAVLHVDIPVFRILAGLIIIYVGLKVITGWHGCVTSNAAVFSEYSVASKDLKGDYSVVFGKGTIDMTGADIKDKTMTIRIDTVFGETTVLVDKNIPLKVQADAVFSGVKMPNGDAASIGSLAYTSPEYRQGENCLIIKADTVFGALKIINK